MAAYERQWIVAPKAPEPAIPVVAASIDQPSKSPSPSIQPKVPRKFIPALPSNPRPKRRPSVDGRNSSQDAPVPLLARSATTAARVETTPRLSTVKPPEAPISSTTQAPHSPPPVRVPSPLRKDSSDSQKDVATQAKSTIPLRKDSLPPSPKSVEGDGSSAPSPPDTQATDSTIALASSKRFDLVPQQPLYLRVIDIPPSQRSSDTMPTSFSLEATNETGDFVNHSIVDTIPSNLLESLDAVKSKSSPTSSAYESDRPLTPLAEVTPSLQPAPLNFKSQATFETVAIQPPIRIPTLPAKSPDLPAEVPLPPVPEGKPAQPPHQRTLSEEFKSDQGSESPPQGTPSPPTIESLVPRSLATHLLSLENVPRKLYLASHPPFLQLVATSQANTIMLSQYLARERIYLHSTIRLLSLLLANVILPTKPSGLLARRKGGIREKQRLEMERAEKERKEKAQKDQNGFNSGNSTADEEEKAKGAVEGNVHRDVSERAVNFLMRSLTLTRKKLALFEEVEEDISGIDLDGSGAEIGEEGGMSALTMFVRLFGEIGGAVEKRERSLLAGLVMLYAREKAHLDSWLDVKATLSTRPQTRPSSGSLSLSQKRKIEPDRGVVRVYLLPEFTSDESVTYVEDMGKLVDDLWADKYIERDRDCKFLERKDILEAKKGRIRGGGWEDDRRGFEELFEMVLDIQGRFWPVC